MRFGIIGNGSWATALVKILTDNRNSINWWVRIADAKKHIEHRKHNPHYLSSAYFDTSLLNISTSVEEVVANSDVVVIAVPSAYVENALSALPSNAFENKKVVSAVKGILLTRNQLIHEYLNEKFNVDIQDYVAIVGPCHAEEVAAEKLSYLTFAGVQEDFATSMAHYFSTEYIRTTTNYDVVGVQYAAVLKNIYALGAGIAHGLEYGDNFLSVYISNAAHEMSMFVKKTLLLPQGANEGLIKYTSAAYLGDLLVTCYSLHSRNRMFGNMIGKGYSVRAASLELNMVAEGYNACRGIVKANEKIQAPIPIVTLIYEILWKHLSAEEGFRRLEKILI